ncbi:MAG: peptide deformylase [Chthoniobacterales bacterium]
MILEIVSYGHPALRAKGRRIEKIDEKLVKLADDMLETMHEANGIGLAAQQIGRPVQFCVIHIDNADEDPKNGNMWIGGEKVNMADYMPLALVNPEIERSGEPELASEGCLSFPGISGEVERPPRVAVKTQLLDGSLLEFEADGLLARAVQHEHDHLHGILFIDKMPPEELAKIQPEINALLA